MLVPKAHALARARRAVRDYLTAYCGDEGIVDDMVLCVGEASANAVRHSGTTDEIEIFLGFRGADLEILVKDRGRGFDTTAFDCESLPDTQLENGRGLFLMSHLADLMELHRDCGTEVRLLKRGVLAAQAPAEGPDHLLGVTLRSTIMERRRDEGARDELREALDDSERRYRMLFDGVAEGVALHELVETEGAPGDYRILEVNAAFERLTGLAADDVRGRLAGELYGMAAPFYEQYAAVARGGAPAVIAAYFAPTERHVRITAVSPGPGRFATILEDVTEQSRAAEERAERRAADERRAAQEEHRAADERAAAEERAAVEERLAAAEERAVAAEERLALAGARAALAEERAAAAQRTAAEAEERAVAAEERAAAAQRTAAEAEERAVAAEERAAAAERTAAEAAEAAKPTPPPPPAALSPLAATDEERSQADELAERIALAHALSGVNRLLLESAHSDAFLCSALDAGVRALGADAGAIELRAGDDWVVRCQSGLTTADVGRRLSRGEAPNATRATSYRAPFATADMQATATDVGLAGAHGLRAVLAIPLFGHGAVIGCLLFYGKTVRVFSDAEIDFGGALGAAVSLALDNARLTDERRAAAAPEAG